jgi:hypothetical protein
MTGPPGDADEWTAALKDAAAQIGAARMAAAVAAVQGEPGPLHPDIIRGIERLTGETYDPATGAWTRPEGP